MARKSFGRSLFWLALLPVSALLFAKHASVKFDERDAYVYTFGKKSKNGRIVAITNQTPSKLAKTAVSNCFKSQN